MKYIYSLELLNVTISIVFNYDYAFEFYSIIQLHIAVGYASINIHFHN